MKSRYNFFIGSHRTLLVLSMCLSPGFLYADNADYYFDAASSTAWDNNTTTNWGTAAAGPYNTIKWSNYNIANFVGTGTTVNMASGIAVNHLTFAADGYVIKGTSLGFGSPGTGTNVTVTTGTATIEANITHGGGINNWNKLGNGTLILKGSDTSNTGVSIKGGTLQFASGTITSSGHLKVADSGSNTGAWTQTGGTATFAEAWIGNFGKGTFNLTGNGNLAVSSTSMLGVRADGTINLGSLDHSDAPTLTMAAGLTFGYSSSLSSATKNTLNLNSGTFSTTLLQRTAGAGTATVNFNGGTLQAKQDTTTFMEGLTSANVLEGGARIDTNGKSITIAQQLLHGGVAAGDGGLIKSGAGTLTLTASNTYTGETLVSAGSLYVNGALGNSTTTVSSSATLGGNGTIGGGATVSGILDPGSAANTIGTLTFSQGLALAGTSTFNLNSTGATSADKAAVTANLLFGGTLNVTDLATTSAFALGQSYDLFDFATSSGAFSQVNLPTLPAGLFWDSSQLYVSGVISVVPESSSALLGGLGGLLLLRRRRR